jgi:hypothetical protein
MLDPQRAILADDRMKKAKHLTDAVYDKLTELAETNRKSYETFYGQLVLISGSTIALSVTYLGYRKTTQLPVVHPHLLVTTWVFLLLCLLLSVFTNFFYAHYLTYGRQSEYAKRLAEQFETEAEELQYVRHLPPLTHDQLAKTCAERQEIAKARRGDSTWNKRRANLCWLIWKWGGLCARTALVIGMIFLVMFAIVNFQTAAGANAPTKNSLPAVSGQNSNPNAPQR